MSTLEVGLVAGLIGWLAISVAAQFPPVLRCLRGRSFLGLIPNWFLFTSPWIRWDLRVEVRREVAPDRFDDWRVLSAPRLRGFRDSLWHPERRLAKALLDVTAELVQLRLDGLRHEASGAPASRQLLRLARLQAPEESVGAIQFRVSGREAGQSGTRKVLFVSDVHEPPAPEAVS